ncbi:F0F1 ATP synthase subunit B [Aquimarina agarilytica]|uniref:F0F1 ATP synthase subunit B n=1 Tax=Aquimarina agarilytica TaxID=1087449 RepID=UPI000289CF64|nr:F0F1 ATP synthase subunit B [Aquimarina agarilytica]
MNLLNDFSPGLFVMQAVILLILILLMRKFAWKPILDSLNDREDGIQSALDAAENAKKELQNLQADNERILNEARAERDGMLKEARELKASMIASAKEEAQAEADKVIKQAQEAIKAEKKAAVADLKNQVAGISVEIAEKVVKNELADKNKQLELVSSLLKEVTLN